MIEIAIDANLQTNEVQTQTMTIEAFMDAQELQV